MPLIKDLRKVMVIGSGPIIIGQAAEFDYAGTQACRALKEEGLEVVLINSNPATIMTDANMADRVYIEPLTPEFVRQILLQEKPDGVIATLGGQVGLNLALNLARSGVLEETGVPLLGTTLEAIMKAEDRDLFRETMRKIKQPIPQSAIVEDVEAAVAFADTIGYPVIVRPAYTLGGTGGGVVHNREQLTLQANKGLKMSIIHQILVEQSVAGYKEIEFEVMRDANNNCITICSMENLDPVGIHTGDSIVIAPAQTLDNIEYEMLRTASLDIIRALGIAGGCNVQYALDPVSRQYYVIEVNPRVSRSSALASKATGYPIARVATKIAIGYNLDEIRNEVTGTTSACFEPTVDYVVIKVPRWPFDKFTHGDRQLGTQMKATGEVMAIDRTIEAAILKAFRSLEVGVAGLRLAECKQLTDQELEHRIQFADDERFYLLTEAIERGMTIEELFALTKIDRFFLRKLENIVLMGRRLVRSPLTAELLRETKRMGFSDVEIAQLARTTEAEVRRQRKEYGIIPTYKIVDTCAAEIEAATPYFYSCYEEEDEAADDSQDRKVLVIGAGPIRIGQGVEFDYCSVHCVWALREAGIKAIIVNNNPETVSTDFDTSDRLYFEPLLFEDVMNIIEEEKPEGVIVQFGGQTAINLAGPLAEAGVPILGTSVDDIDRAEDRDRFDLLVESLGIPRPRGRSVYSTRAALEAAGAIGYPVLVRPSYVLGGRAMEIVYNEDELQIYMNTAVKVSKQHPVLVDKYLMGKELEVDAISDGTDVLIPGIMEHVERAGVHSGDSIAVYPPLHLKPHIGDKMVDYTMRLSRALNVKGIINIQFVEFEDELYVIEVNPRSSRTVPFMSKVTGVPMIHLATQIILGQSLQELGYENGLYHQPNYYTVKVPVFSFAKLGLVDVSLGPEMKSTGEVMGVDPSYEKALFKGFLAAGFNIPQSGSILATIGDKDKEEALPILRGFIDLGFSLVATAGTAEYLQQHGIAARPVNKISEGPPTVVDLIRQDQVCMVVNTLNKGRKTESDGFKIRRAAVEMGVPCLTSLDTTRVMLEVMRSITQGDEFDLVPLQEYLQIGVGVQ